MAIKIFLDTNIILDFLDNRRPSHKEAVIIFNLIDDGEVLACISESVITTADYILEKFLSKSIRTNFLKNFISKTQILPCNNLIVNRALTIVFDDLEDIILYQIALENKIDYFITSDTKLLKGTSKNLPIVSALKFLNSINRPS